MFDTRTRLLFFGLPKRCSWSRLKKCGSGSGTALTVVAPGGSGSATLIWIHNTGFQTLNFRIDSVLRQEVERARQVTELAQRSLILAGKGT